MLGSLLFWLGIFLCALSGLVWGVLSMFSPKTLRRFTRWYTRADTWSAAKELPRVGRRVSECIAGFFAALMSGWIALQSLGKLLGPLQVGPPAAYAPPPTTGNHWSALGVAVVSIGLGIYGVLRPQMALNLTKANFPDRELSGKAKARALQGGRVLGAVTIMFGVFVLVLWYRWTH